MINKYQEETKRTMNKDLTFDMSVLNMCLGLTGETGEVIDLLKKHIFQGHELNVEKLEEEIGDVMWYVSNLCNLLGIKLEHALQGNIEKLRKRYPDGFSVDKSVLRKENL